MTLISSTTESLTAYFQKKCEALLKENTTLLLDKLSDPLSFIKNAVSGSLVDAVKGGDLQKLKEIGESYLEDNAVGVAAGVLKATGQYDNVTKGLDLALNLVATLLSLKNDLVFLFMKKVAESAVKELDAKAKILKDLNETLLKLLAALASYDAGDPVFEAYLARLREGLGHVVQAEIFLVNVENTFRARDVFLATQWTSMKEELHLADTLIRPLDDNPYLQVSVQGLANNLGLGKLTALGAASSKTSAGNPVESTVKDSIGNAIPGGLGDKLKSNPSGSNKVTPTQDQQIGNILAIPALTNKLLTQVQSYMEHAGKANQLIEAWFLGVEEMTSAIPAALKKYIVQILDEARKDLGKLKKEMAVVLNGGEGFTVNPRPGYVPTPLNVSVNAFKWILDLHLAIQVVGTVPESALAQVSLNAEVIEKYKRLVAQMRLINTYSSGAGIVVGREGSEELGALESQLFSLMVEANFGLVGKKVRKEGIALGKAVYARNLLALQRDGDVRALLQSWIDTPIPDEESLQKLLAMLQQALGALGLDKAQDMLGEGKISSFFKLNPKKATYAGAALEAIALLKECFKTEEEKNALDQVQTEVQKDQDLLNVNLSFDFDLAILKNLADCLNFTDLATLASTKEALCGILGKTGIGDTVKKIQDLVAI